MNGLLTAVQLSQLALDAMGQVQQFMLLSQKASAEDRPLTMEEIEEFVSLDDAARARLVAAVGEG